jgi:uncharacterized membrane protein
MTLLKQGLVGSLWAFVKATIIGGLLFLVPAVLVLMILGQAVQLANKVIKPILEFLPDTVLGVGAASIVAVLVLIVVAFVAGIVARTSVGKRLGSKFEHSLLGGLPQYQMIKSMTEGLAQVQSSAVKPALVNVGDGWQLGYLIESLGNQWVAVFLPQSPTPLSGNVMYLHSDKVRLLDASLVQAMAIVKHMGIGSSDALRSTDLTLPVGS